MDHSLAEVRHLEADLQAIGARRRFDDLARCFVDDGAAIVGLIDVGKAPRRVAFHIGRRGLIDRACELKLKAIGERLHGADLERQLAGPHQPLKRIVAAATRAPPAVGAADIERAVGGELDGKRPASKTLSEGKAGPLHDAVDRLQAAAHEDRMRLIGDEHLPGKRPKLPLRRITHHPRRALPHKIVRENDDRWAVLRDPLHLLRPPAAAPRLGRLRPHLRRQVIPLESARMANELPRPQLFERARSVPRPLVVGVEHLPCAVKADPAGGSDAGGGGDRAAVGGDAHRPATKRHFARKAPRQAEHDPQVSFGVKLRSEGIFVVVARDAPAIGHRLDLVGLAVAIGVLKSAHLRPLRRIEPAILPG